MATPILRTTGLMKRFGQVKALSDVDFSLERGEIHALLGVNGAGKSTFIKIVSGVYVKDGGEIEIDGERVEIRSPADAIQHGVATVQQHPELVMDLNGYQNIFLGREGARAGLLSRIDNEALKRRGDALLARFPLEVDLSRQVGTLSAVEREIIAVLQALSGVDIKLMILDEPTSTLTEVEMAVVFRMMKALKDSGISIIYITHRLEEVIEIADRFTVFRGGCRITTMRAAEVAEQGHSLAQLMLGEALDHVYPPKASMPPADNPTLEIRGLHSPGVFNDVNFEARKGEILGIFGLVGSGLDELSKALFGVGNSHEGDMVLDGRRVAPRTPKQAVKDGIFLVPGDRRTEGLTLTQGSIFNIQLANLGRASGLLGLLRRRDNRRSANELAARVDLSPPNLDRPMSKFSGGNQQKIVIAKGIFTQARVYIFVEPTVGVDIGARAKLYALIRELSDTAAVIIMSTDCDEVHGLADRCFALYKGRQVGPCAAEPMSRNQLLTAGMMGRLQ
jgi:ABC-type sugar transport system ATPase subunit